jgi:DNA repair exonuclease SbcCD ATPase subunit
MPLKDDILALSKLKRTRNNLELIQEQLGEIRSLADDAESANELLTAAREAVQELDAGGDADGNPFTEWWDEVAEAAEAFLKALPEEGESIDDLISEAEGYAEEYESCLDDRDYSADDREEVWGNLCNALEEIAGAMT